MENYKNSYKVAEKELTSLSVYNVGFQQCSSGYIWGPGIRDHYLIHYIISGKGTYTLGTASYSLKKGDCFLVYPSEQVIYQADKLTPWEYIWVGFNGGDVLNILERTDFTRENPVIFFSSQGDVIHQLLLTIYNARGNDFSHAMEMSGRLYLLLGCLLEQSNKTTGLNTTAAYVQKAIEFITNNYSYPITVEDIASYVGLSRSHLFRCFLSVFSLSPKEYLTNFRMKQAIFLLEHSDLSITTIANSVGFENSLYFSKIFHQKNGDSPSKYRNTKKATST